MCCMMTKNGDICYRSLTSRCQKCKMYISGYKCWLHDYIPYRTWQNIIGYECDKFESSIKDQCNSHYIHQNYEDRKLFPEKVFGQGKYRFDSKGNRI